MEPWQLALLLKPLVFAILLAVVIKPLACLLWQLVPPGRLKVVLFRVRDGPTATRRDTVVMWLACLVGYAVIIAVGVISAHGLGSLNPPWGPALPCAR